MIDDEILKMYEGLRSDMNQKFERLETRLDNLDSKFNTLLISLISGFVLMLANPLITSGVRRFILSLH